MTSKIGRISIQPGSYKVEVEKVSQSERQEVLSLVLGPKDTSTIREETVPCWIVDFRVLEGAYKSETLVDTPCVMVRDKDPGLTADNSKFDGANLYFLDVVEREISGATFTKARHTILTWAPAHRKAIS